MSRPSRSRFAVLLVLALAPAVASAEEFEAFDVTLLQHLHLGDFPSNPSSASDCWGYVSPGGREYALIGVRDAVVVVDITDPDPVIVASVPHQSSNWCDIRTYGSFAYAVNETGGGLDVIDLSLVDSGEVTYVQSVTDGGLQTVHNICVDETSGYLYLASPNINQGRLVALSLQDPADPVMVGFLPTDSGEPGHGAGGPEHDPGGVSHDVTVHTYTSGPYAGRQIAFSSSGTDGLELFDVTDKANMLLLSTTSYPNHVYSHQAWLSEDLQRLYLNDELDGVNETVVFDVSDVDLATIPVLSTYSSGVDATDHNVFVHQGRVYEGEYRAGMRVFDVAADALNPPQVGWIDTYPGDDSAGSGGVWGVWPFFPSGKVIISDKNRGLFVVWPDAPPLEFDFPAGRPPGRIRPDGDDFVVRVDVEPGHVLNPMTVSLVYDFGQGSVQTPMVPMGGGLFRASFGPVPCGSLVQYHLRASTNAGISIRQPASAPCDTMVAVAAYDADVVLEDGFEAGTGWTVAGNAQQGDWVLGDPIGSDAQSEVDHSPGDGTRCFVTGQGPVDGNIGDADVDGGFTVLVSPTLDLTGFDRATIAYYRWYHNSFSQIDGDEGNGPNEDVLRVQISDDGGGSWTDVEVVGPAGPETAGSWFLHAFDAGSLVDLTADVRLRFIASDVGSLSIVEAAIDDLLVVSADCDAGAPPFDPNARVPLSIPAGN